jgi:DNA modification methylase
LFSDKNPFRIKETIIWNKGGSINLPQQGIYSRKCEFIFVMSANETYLTSQKYGDCRWNYWETKKINQREDHKATFTVELSDMGVDQFSFVGNFVYDPFGGSGSTLIACEKTARDCRMMELDPKYCDVIVKRWQDFTGETATHEQSEQTFAEMQESRGIGE